MTENDQMFYNEELTMTYVQYGNSPLPLCVADAVGVPNTAFCTILHTKCTITIIFSATMAP